MKKENIKELINNFKSDLNNSEKTKIFSSAQKQELNNIIKLIESHDKPDKKQILKVLGLFFKLLTEGAIILKHFL